MITLERFYLLIPFEDAYDLMTGVWIPRKGPSSALFMITDTRPLVLRAVGPCDYSQDVPDYGFLSRQVPYILSFSLFMILAGLTLPRSSGASEINVPLSAPLYSLIFDFRLLADVLFCALV